MEVNVIVPLLPVPLMLSIDSKSVGINGALPLSSEPLLVLFLILITAIRKLHSLN
jgi:hypothetical protein